MSLTDSEAREVIEALAEIVREHGGTGSYGKELVVLGMVYEDGNGLVVTYGFDLERKRNPRPFYILGTTVDLALRRSAGSEHESELPLDDDEFQAPEDPEGASE